jgi:hypothetical protein
MMKSIRQLLVAVLTADFKEGSSRCGSWLLSVRGLRPKAETVVAWALAVTIFYIIALALSVEIPRPLRISGLDIWHDTC